MAFIKCSGGGLKNFVVVGTIATSNTNAAVRIIENNKNNITFVDKKSTDVTYTNPYVTSLINIGYYHPSGTSSYRWDLTLNHDCYLNSEFQSSGYRFYWSYTNIRVYIATEP